MLNKLTCLEKYILQWKGILFIAFVIKVIMNCPEQCQGGLL